MPKDDWYKKALEINAQMDLWVRTEKQRGTWETNAPTKGQEYYASLVSAALRETRAQALEEAAKVAEKATRCSFHDCVYCRDAASAHIRALARKDGGREPGYISPDDAQFLRKMNREKKDGGK